MYQDSGAWNALMDQLVRAITAYVNAQITAGAQAIQLFDSWVGCLAPQDYRTFLLPHMQTLIQGVTPGVPLIHFGTGTAGILELLAEAGGDVIGVDWRTDLDVAWERIGADRAVQGNLDPLALVAPLDTLRQQVQRILDQAKGQRGPYFQPGTRHCTTNSGG